jgi:hypothetical protein
MFAPLKVLLALLAVQAGHALPQHTTCSPSAATQPTTTAAAGPQLSRDAFVVPKELVQDEKLLSGQALRDVVVFDFNGALPAPGALGGATKAAVSHVSHDVLETS